MMLTSMVRFLVVAVALLALTGCKTSEERAEEHYQNALELIAADDVESGMVELRNVFKLDGEHREARTLYATKLLEFGTRNEAYSQFLRLVEQFPEDGNSHLALAEIAVEFNDFETAEGVGIVGEF